MNSRPDSNPEITSACDIYLNLIKSLPVVHTQRVGGGVAMNMSSGSPSVMPSSRLDSFDKDTNNILRSKCACELDLVVSPYSNDRNILFTSREEYPKQLEAKTKEELERKENGWFSRFRKK